MESLVEQGVAFVGAKVTDLESGSVGCIIGHDGEATVESLGW